MSGQTWKVLVQTKEIMKVDVIISVTAERARPLEQSLVFL